MTAIVAPARSMLRAGGFFILALILAYTVASFLEGRLFGPCFYMMGVVAGIALQVAAVVVLFRGARNIQLRTGRPAVATALAVAFVEGGLLLLGALSPLVQLILDAVMKNRQDVIIGGGPTLPGLAVAALAFAAGVVCLVAGVQTVQTLRHPELAGFYQAPRGRQRRGRH